MGAEKIHRAEDVYGIGRELPMNYVERPAVDSPFVDNLSRNKHVVVFGSSKQGKSSLRKYALQDDDCVTVSCLNTMMLQDLHKAILKAIGYKIEASTTKTETGAWKVIAKFSGKGKVPFIAEAGAEGGLEKSSDKKTETVYTPLELELADVNDIITAINEIELQKFIVLEDFHYLPVETQRNFCFALKSFHENSDVCFIVIGVWRDKGRLEYYNGYLTGRVISIDADEWSQPELKKVISIGEALLNVEFHKAFVEDLCGNCHDAVHIVQEACLRACHREKVFETQEDHKEIGSKIQAKDIILEIVSEQAGRYNAFVNNFAEGFQKTGLEMYKWLICAVLKTDVSDLEKGMRRSDISSKIKELHPEGGSLNEGNITQALQNTASLQIQKGVRPIVLDYDETTRVLHVVDKSFLIWLTHHDTKELLSELGVK